MSAEVMTEIHKILQKYTNLSVKITMSSNEDTRYTTISFKESNCLKKTEKKKKRKSPSQVKRDRKRKEAFLARMASSGDQDSAAAMLLLPTAQRSNPTGATRRTATPGRRLGLGAGSAGTEEGDPERAGSRRLSPVRVGFSPIPQIDGGGGGSHEEESIEEEESDLKKHVHNLHHGTVSRGEQCNACNIDISSTYTNNYSNNYSAKLCDCDYKLCLSCAWKQSGKYGMR